jgi:hypothetical protein
MYFTWHIKFYYFCKISIQQHTIQVVWICNTYVNVLWCENVNTYKLSQKFCVNVGLFSQTNIIILTMYHKLCIPWFGNKNHMNFFFSWVCTFCTQMLYILNVFETHINRKKDFYSTWKWMKIFHPTSTYFKCVLNAQRLYAKTMNLWKLNFIQFSLLIC